MVFLAFIHMKTEKKNFQHVLEMRCVMGLLLPKGYDEHEAVQVRENLTVLKCEYCVYMYTINLICILI